MKLLAKEETLQPSTKKVWQLKKYPRSSEETQQHEQQQYATMEFSPQKSTRRPEQKPGEQKQFVFVNLSPKKNPSEQQQLAERPKEDHIQDQIMRSTEKRQNKRQGLSRLFRLSTDKQSQQLQDSPDLDRVPLPTVKPTTPIRPPSPIRPQILEHHSISSSSVPLKRTMTPLVMTVSSDGRAILQHSSSASSSTTDLYSLSHRSPSPKRDAESMIHEYSSEEEEEEDLEEDATRAFEKALSRRKRANTANSISSSISRNVLTRNQSISSISSISFNRARASPARPQMLHRQTTPVEARPLTDDFLGSYFDDASNDQPMRRGFHIRAQNSISTLGPAMGMDDLHLENPDLSLNKPVLDDMTQFFDFGAFADGFEDHQASNSAFDI